MDIDNRSQNLPPPIGRINIGIIEMIRINGRIGNVPVREELMKRLFLSG